MKVNQVVDAYIKLRDLKKTRDDAHKAEVAKINKAMDDLEAKILQHLDETGSDSIKTGSGTAYRSRRTSASVADWDEFLPFVIENELWSMLERRVNKTTVEQYREANDAIPPGVNYASEFVVNVRR